MSYKLNSNVFFKKVSDDQINILLADDDNFIFKMTKVAAQVFLMHAEKNMAEKDVRASVLKLTGKPEAEVDAFLKDFYKSMLEQKFLVKG